MNQKRDQLIDTAIRLFAKEGVGVATAKIAKESNVSNGTLFNHFATKQDLINNVYLHIKSSMAHGVLGNLNMDQPLHDLFLDVWVLFAKWHQNNITEITTLDLLKSSQLLSDEVKEQGSDAWINLFQKVKDGLNDGTLVHMHADIIFLSSEALLNAFMRHASYKQLSASETETLIKNGFEIFWRGISNDYQLKEK